MKMLITKKAYKQSGIGLIELMISMFIGLFIMAGVVQMFSTTSQNAVASAGISRIQENSRYVYSRIARDIAQSGNLGCISTSNASWEGSEFMDNMLGLSSAAGEAYDFNSIANGDQSATAATDPGNVALGTDTFRIRYVNHLFSIRLAANPVGETPTNIVVDTTDQDYSRLAQYQVVAFTNCTRGAIFMITNDPSTSGGSIEFQAGVTAPSTGINPGQFNTIGTLEEADRAWGILDGSKSSSFITSPSYLYGGTTGAYLYFIGTAASAGSNTCATVAGTNSGPQYCALFRRHKGNNEELVEGVSNMEVYYGWTDATGLLFFSRANGVTDWSRVDRLRVYMDFNSVDGVTTTGNNIDSTGLITRQVERTFNLSNQL